MKCLVQNNADKITGAQLTKYLHGSGIAARIAPGGDVTEYVRNAHGDVVSIINPSGTLNYEYDAFGNQKTNTADSNPFRYCGEYYDNETGFIYLRNRYYDPSIGRFTTEDPVKDGDNWYVYCGNNPVNAIDPFVYIS